MPWAGFLRERARDVVLGMSRRPTDMRDNMPEGAVASSSRSHSGAAGNLKGVAAALRQEALGRHSCTHDIGQRGCRVRPGARVGPGA